MLRARMIKEDQGVPKPKLGDAPLHPQEIFKKIQASKPGVAPVASPPSSTIIRFSLLVLYFYCFTCYVLNLECLF